MNNEAKEILENLIKELRYRKNNAVTSDEAEIYWWKLQAVKEFKYRCIEEGIYDD